MSRAMTAGECQKVRKKERRGGRVRVSEYADEIREEKVTLSLPLTYRDHFVDMVDVLENCSLPGLTRF